MAENFANEFATTLAAGVDSDDTTIVVASSTGSPAVNFRIRVDSELMLVTAKAGDSWTVTRNIEGSTPSAHLLGAEVVHVLTAGGFAQYVADRYQPLDGALTFLSAAASDDAVGIRDLIGLGQANTPIFAALGLNGNLTVGGNTVLTGGLLAVSGGQFDGQILAVAGSAAAPSYAFTAQTNLGFYRAVAGAVDFVSAGTQTLRFGANLNLTPTGIVQWASVAPFTTPDVMLQRDAAGVLAQRNGTSAQEQRWYRTFTDAANYERLALRASFSGTRWGIITEAGGTGSGRSLDIGAGSGGNLSFFSGGTRYWTISTTGAFHPETDNTPDFGTTSFRARNVYWGTQALAPNGSNGIPAYSFAGDTNTGLYSSGADEVSVTNAGTQRHIFSATRYTVASSVGEISINGDVILVREAANILGFRNGVAGQVLRLYETYTDAANYERLSISCATSTATIITEGAGTGAAGSALRIGTSTVAGLILRTNATDRFTLSGAGHFVPDVDIASDIGSASFRLRDLFVGRNFQVDGNATLGDASGDTLTINAGTWTFGANWTATRSAGTVGAGTQNILTTNVTLSADAGGTTNARGFSRSVTVSGANPAAVGMGELITFTSTSSAAITGAYTVYANMRASGAGQVGSARAFMADMGVTSTGNMPTAIYYGTVVPTMSSTGTITTVYGFHATNLGNALIGTAVGLKVDEFTAATVAMRGVQSSLTAGTGKHNIYADGTAPNYLAGLLGIGSLPLSDRVVNIQASSTLLTGVAQRAISISQTFGDGATTDIIGIRMGLVGNAGAAPYTTTDVVGVLVIDPVKGANQTVTRYAQFMANDITAAFTSRAVALWARVSAAAGKYNIYADGTADNAFAGAIYPAKETKVLQSNAAIYAGNGAPNNANGNNGDFYLRGDGTVAGNTVVYHKEAGAWVACTTA